jgi:carbon-monoxide dehydrogenase large subunit
VQRVFTGAELQEQLGSLPIGWVLPDQNSPPHPPLAFEKVRYVGDAVAAIVADSPYAAQDAVDLVRVDYEPLEAVIDGELSSKKGAPLLHEDASQSVELSVGKIHANIS